MLDYAKDYVFNKGYSVIPLIPKDKRPMVKWDIFQKRRPNEDELRKWFSGTNNNIGIVAGEISNLSVIDLDGKEAVDFFKNGHKMPPTPVVKTGKDHGYHIYCRYNPGLRNFQTRTDLPHIDLRSEGGYVVAPPSIHPNGKTYRWIGDPKSGDTCEEVPAWFLDLVSPPLKGAYNTSIYNNNNLSVHVVGNDRTTSTTSDHIDHKLFSDGRRDEDLFHVANAMVKGGLETEYARNVLNILINSWGEHDPKWAESKIISALKRSEVKHSNVAADVRDWVLTTSGHFSTTDCQHSTTLTTKQEKKAANMALLRMLEEGLIERCGKRNGCFKRIEKVEETNWCDVEVETIPIFYPFGIDRLVYTLPKSIIVLAGTSDAGKTAFLLNMVEKNCEKFTIRYFSSEMGPMEIKDRLNKFGYPAYFWRGKFHFYEKAADFASAIHPNDINIIDYLEIEDFTQVAIQIREIFDKLNQGICIIAIQKKFGSDLARGGELSMEKARLYINLDPGELRIRKAKNWKSEVNPCGLIKNFKLVQGHKIMEDPRGWYRK